VLGVRYASAKRTAGKNRNRPCPDIIAPEQPSLAASAAEALIMSQPPPAPGPLQERVRERTLELLAEASSWLRMPLPEPSIRFDLRGRAAGQARVGHRTRTVIRYNPVLLRDNPDDFLDSTVPHEVAHVVAFARHGAGIRPHGPEWIAIMQHLGAAPRRCHDYDIAGLKTRTFRELDYHCACRGHRLTSIRHRRALAGQIYICRRCGSPLQPGIHPDAPPDGPGERSGLSTSMPPDRRPLGSGPTIRRGRLNQRGA
jgi:SprT protein